MMVIKTLRKECTYKNEKYKVTVKAIYEFISNYYYLIKIKKCNHFLSKRYVIDCDNTYKEAVEKAFKEFEEDLKAKELEDKEIEEFNSWNGVIE